MTRDDCHQTLVRSCQNGILSAELTVLGAKMSPRPLWSVVTILLLVSRSAMSAPSCAVVSTTLAPCLTYLQGSDPSDACCAGIKSLSATAKTKDDRVAICNCGKVALSKLKYDPSRIPPLPKKCGVNLSLPPIDSHTDCSK
ncbi:non-specific lipid-transfer protein-like [Cornus florida]|uniref:non-specific lipid-transfer protein-like n=1 Tax=Cornus florida TaxID=4283 RepID=UPI0028995DA9|nr:non-specific lipid-transfer protein-like [Cornus florida]